jgi:hypothetical protein
LKSRLSSASERGVVQRVEGDLIGGALGGSSGERRRRLDAALLGVLGQVVQLEVGRDRRVVVEHALLAARGEPHRLEVVRALAERFSLLCVNSLNSAIAVLGRSAWAYAAAAL